MVLLVVAVLAATVLYDLSRTASVWIRVPAEYFKAELIVDGELPGLHASPFTLTAVRIQPRDRDPAEGTADSRLS